MIYLRVIGVWLGCMCGALFQSPYNRVWDRKLNELLDNGAEIKHQSLHTVTIGKYHVWVSNKYYAYCTPRTGPEVRPSIKTMLRFSDAVDKAYFD